MIIFQTDDLDFWLSKNDIPSASKSEKTMENDVRPTPVITVASDDEQETKVSFCRKTLSIVNNIKFS